MKNVDFLIVGQGLSGSLLALELLKNGQNIQIIDQNHLNSSSKIAAGLINPIMGKKLNTSANFDSMYQTCLETYQSLGSQFQKTYFLPLNQIRTLNTTQYDIWQKKSSLGQIPASNVLQHNKTHSVLKDNFDYILAVKDSGVCQTGNLIQDLQDFFLKQELLNMESFNYEQLKIDVDHVQYKNLCARKIIFCEGHRISENPWFKYLPLQPSKGTIIQCAITNNITCKNIYNFGKWIIPQPDGSIKIGATFDWPPFQNFNEHVNCEQLIEALKMNTFIQPKLIKTLTGVRPATPDQQPLLGLHPKIPSLGIFNGFGTKGSLTIPYYSKLFSTFLDQKSNLEENINISRFH